LVRGFAFDPVSRLASLTQDVGGTAQDLTVNAILYNAASQIVGLTRSNDLYAWKGHYNANRGYTANGLNQLTNVGVTTFGYDGRGNLTSSGANGYTYSAENLLKAGPGGATLDYDPAMRLYQTNKTAITRFGYDGSRLIAEYDGTNAVLRRYVHGPGSDEPLLWYEGAGTADRRWLHSDERGSVITVSNGSGTVTAINAYDEYGLPAATNAGRFQYTGQTWLPELGMYYYKARMYSTTLGRFLQTDPIGYADGLNWYNYVGSDPVNASDPSGLQVLDEITITAHWQNGPPLYSFEDLFRDEEIDRTIELNNYNREPTKQNTRATCKADGGAWDPSGNGGKGGCIAPIVVTGRRTTLPNVLPSTLWSHFLGGSGDTVCLTTLQFNTLASTGKRVGNLKPRAGGGYSQQTSYYGGTYANSFGTATVYLDDNYDPAGFHDYYNFDAHGRNSASAQVKTGIGALGYLAGGKDFSIDYNNGICR
jgi:RHS repeat-associated protein